MNKNDSISVSIKVANKDTAQGIALDQEDNFPAVYATSKMIALMELSAARLMKPLTKEGQLSVGVGIDIKHLAPTPVGGNITSTAIFLGMKDKLFEFKVDVTDDAGLVGTGHHTRAIVETARLLAGAEKRKP